MSEQPVLLTTDRASRAEPYLEGLVAGGLEPARVRILSSEEGAGEAPDGAFGAALLLGGADVEPRRYGETPRADAHLHLDPARDELEWRVLAAAREERAPVLAICRGIQVVNAFFGGSLWQDQPSQAPGPVDHRPGGPHEAPAHPVEIVAAGSPFAALVGDEPMWVNSRHHQAVRTVAPGLTVLARAGDGIVEAVALADGDWWLTAVQWHPENLLSDPRQRALWRAFVARIDAPEPARRRRLPRAS